jgi:D-alanyl-D-alanine carboxypeptidase
MRKSPQPLCFIALFCLVASAVRADAIDDYVKGQMEKQRINGLSLAIVSHGKITKSAGYGFANEELRVPATAETVYKIGSVSKQFIATGIMLLVQDGKLRLDDRLTKFFTDAPEAWRPITIQHLLAHTSGLVREAPGFDPLKRQDDAAIVRTAYRVPLHFQPGEKWEYCNVGYFALADIVRQVAQKSWEDFLTERVFQPVGMTSTRGTTMTAMIPHRANGYVRKNENVENASIYLAVRPSGAFLSNVLDLAKWDAALDQQSILHATTLSQMWRPVATTTSKTKGGALNSYGFGWFMSPDAEPRVVYHGGSLPGFRAAYVKFLADKLTVIVLSNWDNALPDPIARGVATVYLQNKMNAAGGSN